MIRKKSVVEKTRKNQSWQEPSPVEIVPRRPLEIITQEREVSVLEKKEIMPGNKVLHRVNNGEILIKSNEKTCKTCDHARHHHYGSLNHQCNTRGCECDEFK